MEELVKREKIINTLGKAHFKKNTYIWPSGPSSLTPPLTRLALP